MRMGRVGNPQNSQRVGSFCWWHVRRTKCTTTAQLSLIQSVQLVVVVLLEISSSYTISQKHLPSHPASSLSQLLADNNYVIAHSSLVDDFKNWDKSDIHFHYAQKNAKHLWRKLLLGG